MKNTQINADAVKAISCLSALIAKSNESLRADDVAEIVNNYVETAININADVKECIENVIFDYETNSGKVLKVTAQLNPVAFAVDVLTLGLYGKHIADENFVSSRAIISANDPRLDVGVADYFRLETDFNVRVCYTHDKKHLLIVYTEDY